jgi:hypothetical protein
MENRRFYASYRLAGIPQNWPVQIDSPEIILTPEAESGKNVTILRCDITLKVGIPELMYPEHGSPDADGQGDGTPDDPDGYIGVSTFDLHEIIGTGADAQRVVVANG